MIRRALLTCAISLSIACAPLEDFDARRKVICTGIDLEVFPIGMIHLQVGGTWQAYSHLVNTHLKPKDAPLSDSTAYWLYACENKGTLVFRTSTRQPDSGLRYMSGNQGCWFVSRFNTDSLGNVVKYTQTDLSFRFAPTSANILMNGSARTITPIDTKPYIPTPTPPTPTPTLPLSPRRCLVVESPSPPPRRWPVDVAETLRRRWRREAVAWR